VRCTCNVDISKLGAQRRVWSARNGIAWGLSCLLAIGAAHSQTQIAGFPLNVYATSPGPLINGVAVSPSGRVFASLPRWSKGATPGVAEITTDKEFTPFPGKGWNDWTPESKPDFKFVSVHSVYADHENQLWVADEGSPIVSRTVEHSANILPKVVQIDLGTGTVRKVYPIRSTVLTSKGSDIGHVRVDRQYIYVSEPGLGSIIVIDRRSGVMHRRLADVAQSKADPTIAPVIKGEPLLVNGGVPQIHLDLLELDTTGKWLYFMPLFGPHLYKIRIADLVNFGIDDSVLANRIDIAADVPPSTGLTKDRYGVLYLCSLTDMAIVRLDQRGIKHVITSDPRINLPNEPSFGPDGSLYFPVSRPAFVKNSGPDQAAIIYRIGPLYAQYNRLAR
jgi:hypothetical protein